MNRIKHSPLRNIRKVLVANRGEIAVRCIKACKELGVGSVAIFTSADATSLHVGLADEAIHLPGDDSRAYTDGEAILDICKRVHADAVIPGYGFLSENADFAQSVSSAGLVFVGPSPASITAMGLKHEARAIAEAAGVPVVPGTRLLKNAAEALQAARRLGFPVMLKATAGGGGMGLQICHTEEHVASAFATVVSRAGTLFKNSGIFLERYYPRSRHIEVQIVGNGDIVISFGERECSLQRRHQKVVEECPSPFVERHAGLRDKILKAAVDYASQLKYKSVGTVEFLVNDETADFFFLEMNTRLQVEHGITELCYGIDLVHLMLRQADYQHGGDMGIPSEVLRSLGNSSAQGSAIEVRIYAEVPLCGFAPAPGVLELVRWPEGRGIRVDTWVRSGQRITPLYDPLIAKIMVHCENGRATAQKKLMAALGSTSLQGTQCNLEYLTKVIASDDFRTGNTLTSSLSAFKFDSCSVQVLDPGIFTTVQDYPGRTAVGHGVPPGGPMDDVSARVANILVGNNPGLEILEITLAGPELLFHEAAVVAICGAVLPLTIDGMPQPMWSRIGVNKGQKLKLGKVTGSGIRAYLAIKGGFPEIPRFLSSKSTAPELGFGGVQGRKLQGQDILALDSHSRVWASECTPLSLPPNAVPDFAVRIVNCIDGPFGSNDILTPEGQQTLYEAEWAVSHNSGRSGIRLDGPRLKWARASGGGGGSHPSNVFDYGYPDGGVNFTGESPIIFAHDRPDLGGFACPTTVCSAEMWKVGQLKTGDRIRFRSISYETARKITSKKDQYFEAIAAYAQGTSCQIPSLNVDLRDEPPFSILHETPPSGGHPRVTYRQGGDTSIIIEYGDQLPDLRNTACVQLLAKALSEAALAGVRSDPNFGSLTVRFDPSQIERPKLMEQLRRSDAQIGEPAAIKIPARLVRLPICLDHSSLLQSAQRYMDSIRPTAAYLPDNVEYIRRNNALSDRREVFNALLNTPWLTVAVGFYVGTPILFPLDPWRVLTGQKYNPSRGYTPSGAVGLGGSLLAIYPVAAPGGYQLMARTLGGWDAGGNRPGFSAEKPWLFNHLDLIKFHEVSEEEYNKIERDFESGRYVFDITNTTIDMDEYIANFDEAALDPKYRAWQQRKAAAAKNLGELEEKLFQEWTVAKEANDDSTENDDDSSDTVSVQSPIDASIWKILVKCGDVLEQGQTVAILEAMKMEINLIVGEEQSGAVVTKTGQPGSVVSPGVVVVRARRPE